MPRYALNESHPQCPGLAASQALGSRRRLVALLKNPSRIFQEARIYKGRQFFPLFPWFSAKGESAEELASGVAL